MSASVMVNDTSLTAPSVPCPPPSTFCGEKAIPTGTSAASVTIRFMSKFSGRELVTWP